MGESTGWWQVVYGKLVENENGPIRKQSEHHHSAVTPDIPPEIQFLCYPDRLGIGTDDLMHGWGRYRWPDGPGGFIYTAAVAGNQEYVLAARVRGRFEIPELKDRLYTQALYLANFPESAAQWPLLNWWESLIARPSLRDETLDRRAVQTQDCQLPPGPLTVVRTILEHLLGGLPFAATDVDIQPENFYQQLRLALACLPAALRWRIPVGVGLFVIDLDRVAIGQGMETLGPSVVVAPRLDAVAIREYLDRATEIIAASSSLAQIMQLIDKLIPELSEWNAFRGLNRPTATWRDAVCCFAEYWQEVRLFERWVETLRNSGHLKGHASIQGLRHLRVRAIRFICSRLAHSNAQTIAATLNDTVDWHEAWKKVAEECPQHSGEEPTKSVARGLAGLLGAVDLEPKSFGMILRIELPTGWHKPSRQALRAALRKGLLDGEALDCWASLARRILAPDSSTKWFTDGCEFEPLRQDRLLLWLLIHRRKPSERTGLDDSWGRVPELRACLAIICGQSPKPADLSQLCRWIGAPTEALPGEEGKFEDSRRESIKYLFKCAQAASLLIPATWLARTMSDPNRQPTLRRLAEMVLRDSQQTMDKLVRQAWDWLAGSPTDENALRIALAFGGEQGPDELRKRISAKIGPLLGHILLYMPETAPQHEQSLPPGAALACDLFPVAILNRDDVLKRSLKLCPIMPEAARILLKLVKDSSRQDGTISPAMTSYEELQWVRECVTGNQSFGLLPDLMRAEAEQVRAILEEHGNTAPPSQIGSLGQLRAFLASRPVKPPPVEERSIPAVVNALRIVWNPDAKVCKHTPLAWSDATTSSGTLYFSTNDSLFFATCLDKDLNCSREHVWRLFFRNHARRVKYSTVEQEILAKLPLEVLLAMLLANWPPPSSLKARSGPRFSIGDCLFAPVPWKREVWGLPHMQRLLKIAEANRLARLGEFCFQLVVFVSQADAPVDSGVRKLDQTELGNMLSRCRPTISRFITRPLRRGKEPRQYYEEAGRAWRLFYSAGKDEIVPTLRGIWYDVDKAWATYKAQRAVLPKTTPPPPT